jgi:hypothetical protein
MMMYRNNKPGGCLPKPKRTRERIDPVLGTLHFMGEKLGYWEGNVYFRPIGRNIEIFVDGGASDDMKEQHAFLNLLCERWSEFLPAITAAIQTAGLPIPRHLSISGLSIPKASLFEDANWHVSIPVPSGGSYTVEMKGAIAQVTSWDC